MIHKEGDSRNQCMSLIFYVFKCHNSVSIWQQKLSVCKYLFDKSYQLPSARTDYRKRSFSHTPSGLFPHHRSRHTKLQYRRTFRFYPLFNLLHARPISWQNDQLVDGGHYQAETEGEALLTYMDCNTSQNRILPFGLSLVVFVLDTVILNR